MRRLFYIQLCVILYLFTACNVHEWPAIPETVQFHLRLDYETEMQYWDFVYDKHNIVEQGLGETYDCSQRYGKIRYIVRLYRMDKLQKFTPDYLYEFQFKKDISQGYNYDVTLDVIPGEYRVMVWSDLLDSDNDDYFYNAENFAEIKLQGNHRGNSEHKDAFRGVGDIALVGGVSEYIPDTLDIKMNRPLAKFEFITNDLMEFVDKETNRVPSINNQTQEVASSQNVDLEDYKVIFHFVGFMPDAYSIYTDKPVDSSTGVSFESSLKKSSQAEATMGFDYMFVNGKQSAVTVQIGLYDRFGEQLSMTEPIEVPLKRNRHTRMTGSFLLSDASGGVTINPDFDGDHNLIFP